MSKADQLGSGRFGGGARPVSARRAAIGAATGVPTEGVAPPSRLPVVRISPNPDNPRTSLSDLTELVGSLREHGQKQAITVMNRDAYIKANPSRAEDLEPDTTHVVVDGSSRLAAAREAGLTHLNVMVDDEQGSDSEAILESALVANIHRNDLDPLDEARALQRLLALYGSQVKLAKRLNKSQGWVSQRLALLNLTPELQDAVGDEPVELLRSVAKAPQERQQAVLEELKAERARKEAERRLPTSPQPAVRAEDPQLSSLAEEPEQEETTEEPAPPKAKQHATPPASSPSRGVPPTRSALDEQATPTTPPALAAPARPVEEPAERMVKIPTSSRLPYDDGTFIAMHLIRKMSETEFDKMLDVLTKHYHQRVGRRTSAH
ncbi:ParB/RepB/Spo0J family partition protein [Streptomyces sp. NPDC005483]|uniref:ParB/RepB/Spo0J family partition protein n=1 Tax=Streptomyces sp. NPDC005483 TaxID=3154882 RepID=UPI00339F9C25